LSGLIEQPGAKGRDHGQEPMRGPGLQLRPPRAERPLRVCHLGKYYPPAAGGIETHVQMLARGQSQLGVDVLVICVNHASTPGHFSKTFFSKAEGWSGSGTLQERDGPVQVLRQGRSASFCRFDFCPGLAALLRQLPEENVDLLHLHTPNATMLVALTKSRPSLPLVITHHNDIVRQRFLGYALEPLQRLIYKRAAVILATSPAYAAESSVLRRYADKTSVLPLGLDLSPYLQPGDRAIAHGERIRGVHGWPLWLMVGRLVYYKGLEVALQALAHLPGRLLIIGTGPLETRLRRLAQKLGVAERVAWHGHASAAELAGAYRAATCLWFPSTTRSEGFGLVQVEAMASGCPVINTAIPGSGVTWVCPHRETGLTVPVNDPRALARAAWQLLAQPALRRQLGQAARQRAQAEFRDTTMASRSLEIYASALAASASQLESASL
jgi:glycosyltransferase involved in cell wall biosynthesis